MRTLSAHHAIDHAIYSPSREYSIFVKFPRISQNANVELTREGMGKNVTQPKGLKVIRIQVENRSNNLEKRVVTLTFYVIKWKWQTYSACHKFLVVSKSYLDCILAVPKESCHSRFKLRRNDFVVQNVSRVFFYVIFTFLYVKANSKEIDEEMFTYFFRKMLMSAFLLRLKDNYLEKGRGYPYFSFWIPRAFGKISFLHMVSLWRKNLHT